MNSWKTLNIEPTDDKKIIKKAYAVLIKQYKPDEYPEKFKEIQDAYKKALQSTKKATRTVGNPHESVVHQDVAHQGNDKQQNSKLSPVFDINHTTEDFVLSDATATSDNGDYNYVIAGEEPVEAPFVLSQASVNDTELFEQQKRNDQLIEKIYQQLHEMAFAPLALKSKIKNWKFIEDYYKIDELSLKLEVAQTVFKKVAEYNLFSKKENNTYLISPQVLNYLNGIFDWNSLWGELRNIYPDHYFHVTLDSLDSQNTKQSHLVELFMLFSKGFGLFVDVFVYMLLWFIVIDVFSPNLEIPATVVIFGFVVYIMLSETFMKRHASVGKKFMRIVILDDFGNSIDRKTVIKRNLVFHLCIFSPLYFWFSEVITDPDIFIMYALLLWSINSITFVLTKKFLHDYMSHTIVVDIK